MSIVTVCNRFLWMLFLIAFITFASLVDYRLLVDPVYYIKATQLSIDFVEAFEQGERWGTDVLFIVYSFLLGLIASDFNTLAFIFVVSLLFLLFLGLYKYTKSIVFILLLLSVTLSFSTFGLVFNVWRQAFAVLLIMLTSVYAGRFSQFTLFLSIGFHFNSAIFFLPIFFLKKLKENIKLFLPLTVILALALLYFFIVNASVFLNSFLVYANVEAKVALLRNMFGNILFVIYCFNLKFFFNSSVKFRESLLFKFTFFSLLFSTVFLFIAPSASERMMYYFFMLYPFLLIEFYTFFSLYGRLVIVLSFAVFISVSSYFLFYSQTWVNLSLYSIF